eukprot:2068430-Amphidinium_carterae.1
MAELSLAYKRLSPSEREYYTNLGRAVANMHPSLANLCDEHAGLNNMSHEVLHETKGRRQQRKEAERKREEERESERERKNIE